MGALVRSAQRRLCAGGVILCFAASCSLDYDAFRVGLAADDDDGQGAAGGSSGAGGSSDGGTGTTGASSDGGIGGSSAGQSTGGASPGGAGGAPVPVCGDGQVEGTEQCDGEVICNANCTLACPGFTLNGLCYWITSSNGDFAASSAACENDGGGLAILPTNLLIENTFLAACPSASCDHLWVGATQSASATQAGDDWQWFDGSPVSAGIWSPDNGFVAENSGSGDQDCAQILLEGLGAPWLNDWVCDSSRRALCQYPPGQAPP